MTRAKKTNKKKILNVTNAVYAAPDALKWKKKSKFVRPPCLDTCGYGELIFRGEDAAQQFCAYITQPYVKNSILIAHNATVLTFIPF